MKLGAGKSKLGGVKKGGAAIDFEAAERKAREEEERIKRLGYDREQEEKAAAEAAAAANAARMNAARGASPSTSSRGEMVGNKKSAAEMERLGMGFGKLGFGQVAGMSGEEAARQAVANKKAAARAASGYTEPEESTYARDKFSGQKGISSDMYFGRNAYDPQAKAEAQSRLQQFQGATAISSNAYFGREEDEGLGGGGRGGVEESILNVESLSDLERTAKDAARRLMNQYGIEDFSDVQNALRSGAMSVSATATAAWDVSIAYSVGCIALIASPPIRRSSPTSSPMLPSGTADLLSAHPSCATHHIATALCMHL